MRSRRRNPNRHSRSCKRRFWRIFVLIGIIALVKFRPAAPGLETLRGVRAASAAAHVNPTLISCPPPSATTAALSRFELDDGGVTAFLNYKLAGNVIMLVHTETPVAARRRGLGSRLVEGVLQTARARGLKVVPVCSFVRAFLDKHPAYRDLVAT